MQLYIVQQGIKLALDLEISCLALRLLLDQLHLEVTQLLQLTVFDRLFRFYCRDFQCLVLPYCTLPPLVKFNQVQPSLALIGDNFGAILLLLLQLLLPGFINDPFSFQGLFLKGKILLIFSLLDIFKDLLDPALMLPHQFHIFVLGLFELHLHLRAVDLHLKLESLYIVFSLLRFLPHILDPVDQTHLIMQFLLIFFLLDLQDFNAIMCCSDVVFCLDEVLYRSEVGLLASSLDNWILLEGIALSHYRKYSLQKQSLALIIQSMDSEQEDENQQQEDDLLDYQQEIEEKVVNNIMNFKQVVEDDASELQREEKDKPRKQMSEEERVAKEMRFKNARKYFQMVKLTYLLHFSRSLREAKQLQDQKIKIVGKILSLISKMQILEYQRLRKIKPLSMKKEQVLQFLGSIKEKVRHNDLPPHLVFWAICESLGVICRKIHFFDLQSLVQEAFFNLDYHSLDKAVKKQAKRAKEIQKLKKQLHIKKEEEEMKEGNNYLHFQDFQFDQSSFRTSRTTLQGKRSMTQEDNSQSTPHSNSYPQSVKRELNFLRKRNFKWAYFQILCPYEQKWFLVNSQTLQLEEQSQARTYLLHGKPVLGFYSCRLLHFKEEYKGLSQHRLFGSIHVEDLTQYFFDNMKRLSTRRRRVGVRAIMRQLFERGGYRKHSFLLEKMDQMALNISEKIYLQFHLTNFPKARQQMLTSEYFITPSLLPQYSILDPSAAPIEQTFNEQQVFLRKDLLPVTSRLVWIDRGRRVLENAVPVKKTENKGKNMTELFLYEQTEPYELKINLQTGQFIADDQFNSAYIPPGYLFGGQFSIIAKSVGGICSKQGFRHIRLVQGFTYSGGRLLPNYLGYLVYKGDEARICQLWEQRQAKLASNKQKNHQNFVISLWTKLFTKIELSEWSKTFAN